MHISFDITQRDLNNNILNNSINNNNNYKNIENDEKGLKNKFFSDFSCQDLTSEEREIYFNALDMEIINQDESFINEQLPH